MSRLKVGIIGLGVGEKHIPAFESHPNCEVAALCDFSKNKLSVAAKHCPEAILTTDPDEILDNPVIDVVAIASYDNFHFEQVVKSIENKKHVFVEKPLCLDRHEAVVIRKLLNENPDIYLSSNLNLRTSPMFIRLRETIQSGDMGQVFYLEGDYLWGRIHKLTDGWRKDMAFYSIVYGAAVHMIDLIIWITGMNPVEVQGYGNSIATANSGFRYNDFAAILMKFENGMTAKISASGGCVYPHFHRVSVFGTDKSFLHDIYGGKMIISGEHGAEPIDVVEKYRATEEKGKIITSFIDAILDSQDKAIVSCDDVFNTMSVCFAAERAIQEGRPVRVEFI